MSEATIERRVIKRDGRIVSFDSSKIYTAIMKAMTAVSTVDEDIAKKVTDIVVDKVNGRNEIPVEDIQDQVEEALIKLAPVKVIKEFILYRAQRTDVREQKVTLGVEDDLKLTINAVNLLNERYLKILPDGKKETTAQMFRRTAKHISSVEKTYGGNQAKWQKIFYNLLANQIFYPNIPCLSNSGIADLNYLSACYCLSPEDSMDSIFSTAKDCAMIMKSGGGVGLYLSDLRPRNDVVKSTGKVSSGVVGFLPVFDAVVESVKQGGMRRGACLGMIRVDHPDIVEFINCKKEEGKFSNFNLSVAITDKFMNCVSKDTEFALINPRTKKKVDSVRARYLLSMIAQNAWESGDPGIVFFDTCNKNNPTPTLGPTYKNACAEVDLVGFEACNLGSINLTKFASDRKINWEALQKTIHNSIHFLDDVIDASDYPLQKIKEITLANRKVGLGIMGLADLFCMLEIQYNSKEAVKLAGKIMEFVFLESKKASEELAQDRGTFPNFSVSIHTTPMRNASVTVIAPTGEISILANCSPGIEPIYGIVFKRQTTLAVKELITVNSVFENIAKKESFFSTEILEKIIANNGRVTGIKEIPEKWQKIFVTALEISAEDHLKIQSAIQKYCDNSISKTINMPFNSTVSDVEDIIKEAYDLKCNGVTIFRDGCKKQVMNTGENNCPECHIPLIYSEGCFNCPVCGFGKCRVG